MQPGPGSAGRRIIPIQKNNKLEFRVIGNYHVINGKLYRDHPPQKTHEGTIWASCEIGNVTETTDPIFGVTGITSSGGAVYGENFILPVVTVFTDPCPLK